MSNDWQKLSIGLSDMTSLSAGELHGIGEKGIQHLDVDGPRVGIGRL